jgi:hypothetical protein
MLTRREFLGDIAAGVAASMLEPLAFAKRTIRPLGVQLYTVRTLVQSDLPGTLQAIRKIGYRTVETYVAEYKIGARDLRTAVLDADLTVPSAFWLRRFRIQVRVCEGAGGGVRCLRLGPQDDCELGRRIQARGRSVQRVGCGGKKAGSAIWLSQSQRRI